MKLMSVSKYIELNFVKGSMSASTVKRLLLSGEIKGKRIGNKWFVYQLQPESTGNPLADEILGL